ncbi:anaerobic ribonucleoside-triphosphate reductase activating protein [Niallia taxi]|uniref:anaerobic ribonucleoside-triphosphate reductase activating protein n=1 Tax=Niallia taxi TaxID=2499688 RepID=UPI0039823B42
MRVLNIIQDSIVDGPGLRSTVFFAGCPHRCKGCHNPNSWNRRGGTEMEAADIFNILMANPFNDVTFSGGEPFYQNHHELLTLASELKRNGKNIWCYTGYKWEQLISCASSKAVCEYLDVIIDGPFIMEKRDLNLQFMGSSNQRLIAVSLSLAAQEPILFE